MPTVAGTFVYCEIAYNADSKATSNIPTCNLYPLLSTNGTIQENQGLNSSIVSGFSKLVVSDFSINSIEGYLTYLVSIPIDDYQNAYPGNSWFVFQGMNTSFTALDLMMRLFT